MCQKAASPKVPLITEFSQRSLPAKGMRRTSAPWAPKIPQYPCWPFFECGRMMMNLRHLKDRQLLRQNHFMNSSHVTCNTSGAFFFPVINSAKNGKTTRHLIHLECSQPTILLIWLIVSRNLWKNNPLTGVSLYSLPAWGCDTQHPSNKML